MLLVRYQKFRIGDVLDAPPFPESVYMGSGHSIGVCNP